MERTASTTALDDRIVSTPGVCGGKPRIAGSRIKVQHVAIWYHRLGMSPDEIVSSYPQLTLVDVRAALAYYDAHREQIEADIQAGRQLADKLRGESPSILDRIRNLNAGDDSLSPG